MPELPEVETVTRALEPALAGRRIVGVDLHAASLRYPLRPAAFAPVLGRRVTGVSRRAKYIVVSVAGGHCMLLHLGMTGSFRVVAAAEPRLPHDRVTWRLDKGLAWQFNDPRKFGFVEVHALRGVDRWPDCAHLRDLGPEPLAAAFTDEYLFQCARKRRRAVKSLLMDGEVVVGVGNIYASEALFHAGVRPTRRACRLTRRDCGRLVTAVRNVLAAAIRAGGTTIADFKALDGSEGRFSRHLDVYGRAGQSCSRCGEATIKRAIVAGRSSFYCPKCQK